MITFNYYHILGCSALITLIKPCANYVTGVSNEDQRFQITFETSDLKAGIKRVSRGPRGGSDQST